MICRAGITLMTDEAGTPIQVNIDLVRHGAELATFLRAHGLIAGAFGAELPSECSGTACRELSGTVSDDLSDTVDGERLGRVGGKCPGTVCSDLSGTVGGECLGPVGDELSGTVCDDLSGAFGGECLTSRYVPSADRWHIPVVYRSQVRELLCAAVDKVLLSRRARKGTSAPAAEEYAATLLMAAERHLHRARLRHKPAPEGYERYGRDMFALRFRLRCSPATPWIVCYTLHHGTVVVRYIGTEPNAGKK